MINSKIVVDSILTSSMIEKKNLHLSPHINKKCCQIIKNIAINLGKFEINLINFKSQFKLTHHHAGHLEPLWKPPPL